MKRFRLTKASKVLIFIIILAIIGGGVFMLFNKGIVKSKPKITEKSSSISSSVDMPNNTKKEDSTKQNNVNSGDSTINLSLDEWIGWKPIIDANGGLTTTDGSIFDNLGIKVNINIINDAEQSSNALIKGNLNATGYTTNRVAFLSGKFKTAGLDVVMPVFTNYSNGGDGIIATKEFNTVESLVNAKIGVPRFSEAHTLIVWFINKSDLSQADKEKIINNLITFDTPEEAGLAFFAGKIDVAATWQPFLSQAENSTDSMILFDTTASNKLIMDGVVFRKDFAEANPNVISKFIDGIFQAESMYKTEFDYIRETMPMFASSTDQDIINTANDAGLAGYSNNVDILKNIAPDVFNSMCDVWESVGETVDRTIGDNLFDTSYLMALEDKYSGVITQSSKPKITQAQKDEVKNTTALMTKTSTINFVSDTAKFIDPAEASQILDEFIEIAKTLDGTIIQVEGNINAITNTEEGMRLSEERAKTVANYFIANGIDPNRIIIIGNGNTKMIGDMNTEDGKVKNRRTDVFFKTIES